MAYGERRGGGGFRGGGGGFRGGGGFGPREMHKIKCSSCGADAEVPFKPQEGRAVYCKDCYAKQRAAREESGFSSRPPREESEESEFKEAA